MSGRRNQERWEANRSKYRALLDQYCSITAVAQVLKHSRQSVWNALKTYDLQGYASKRHVIKDLSLITDLVFCKNRTYAEVAEQLGCTKDYVAEVMSKISDQAKQTLNKTLQETYAANIRTFRMLQKMTQEDLAKKARVHQSGLSSIENGTRGVTNKVLSRIAGALQVDLDKLLRPLSYEDVNHA